MLANGVSAFTFFVGLLMISSSSFSQSELAGRVTSVTGTVQVIRASGDSEFLQRRDPVYVGDRLISDESSLIQLRFVDSAILLMGCNSSIGINAFRFEQVQENQLELILYAGNLRSIVGRIQGDYHRLRMADSLVQIDGGDFALAIAADETQYFGVYDGSLTVIDAETENKLGLGANANFGRLQPGLQFEELVVQPPILNQSVLSIADCVSLIR